MNKIRGHTLKEIPPVTQWTQSMATRHTQELPPGIMADWEVSTAAETYEETGRG